MIAELEAELAATQADRDAWKAEAERWRNVAMSNGAAMPGTAAESRIRADLHARAMLLASTVAKCYGVTVEQIRGIRRQAQLAEARAVTMYLLREVLTMTVTEAGAFLNRDHSTISIMTTRIEKKARTSIRFSAWLETVRRETENAIDRSERSGRRNETSAGTDASGNTP